MTVHGFWGLKVCPGKQYTQRVTLPFKITMASLTDTITSKKRCSLLVSVDGIEFVLCSLIPEKLEQQVLNTTIMEGEEVTFSIKGDNMIHLTGNHVFDIPEGEDENQHLKHTIEQQKKTTVNDDDDESLTCNINNQHKRKRVAESDSNDATKRFKDDNDLTSPDQHHTSTCKEEQKKLQYHMDSLNGYVEELKQKLSSLSDLQQQQSHQITSTSLIENGKVGQKGKGKSPKDHNNNKQMANTKKNSDNNQKTNDEKQLDIKKKSDDKKETTSIIKKSLSSSTNQNSTAKEKSPTSKVVHLPNGMDVEDKKIGTGRAATTGSKVGVRYVGKLLNGKKFDSNTTGTPFRFTLGKRSVIRGWDIGVAGMKVGGERILTIPPSLAYQQRGMPPDIPPNSTLVFSIKLVELK